MNISLARTSQALFSGSLAPKNQQDSSMGTACSSVKQSSSASKLTKSPTNSQHLATKIRRHTQVSNAVPEKNFQERIAQECIQGSGITPALFNTAIAFVRDCVGSDGGDFESPLTELLEWPYIRFGHQARQASEGAVFRNEDGSAWQIKLDHPRIDKKGKVIKYETPIGNGSKPYLPPVNRETRRAIAERYNVELPLASTSFWNWVAEHPEIPIVITEGAKKALSLLSQGYVAIALCGVDGGARSKDSDGNRCKPYLIPGLTRFTTKGRKIILAFDQDVEAKTRLRVDRAMIRLAALLGKEGCEVSIAFWDGRLGKGIDDLIVNQGVSAWHEAYQKALFFQEWLAHRKLLNQLTYSVDLLVHAPDLSLITLNSLPDQGIVAIRSPKGTGKTKFISQQVQDADKVLVATHRICLGRNLCDRLGVHWRSDLDKANGEFIHGGGYTLRVGFCVDSLLAIDPAKFKECVLVIDEVTQVLRHLLTSTTCRKDGKQPVLLARFRELVQQAKLVIVADADLNNAVLRYLQTLRGDKQHPYLVDNQFKTLGYPCEFIHSPNASAAIARLAQRLAEKKRIFLSTDSKKQSQHLAYQCQRWGVKEEEILLLNSETSGGEREQTFITSPDSFLAENPQVRVVIASPSLCTGVSIESQFFDEVFGLFWGASLTDADIAQGLSRVRDLVPRTVWCARMGRKLCQFSEATRPQEIIHALKTRTSIVAALTRANLREDAYKALTSIDFDNDPHIQLFAQITADTNYSSWNLRHALLARLKAEGHQITVIDLESDPIIQEAMKEARNQIRQVEAEAIAAAPLLSVADRLKLEAQEHVTPEERLSLIKTTLADFYCVDVLTPELVIEDKAGLRRSRLVALENQLNPELALQRDKQGLEKQRQVSKSIVPWDIGSAYAKQQARYALGLDWYLDPDRVWTKYDNLTRAEKARDCAQQVKAFLGLGNLDKLSDTQIVHQLLSQLGLKIDFIWSRAVPGYEGEKLRVYRLSLEVWNENLAVLKRREERRLKSDNENSGSPSALVLNRITHQGDPRSSLETSHLNHEAKNQVDSQPRQVEGRFPSTPSTPGIDRQNQPDGSRCPPKVTEPLQTVWEDV
jgi:hypothetical protein